MRIHSNMSAQDGERITPQFVAENIQHLAKEEDNESILQWAEFAVREWKTFDVSERYWREEAQKNPPGIKTTHIAPDFIAKSLQYLAKEGDYESVLQWAEFSVRIWEALEILERYWCQKASKEPSTCQPNMR